MPIFTGTVADNTLAGGAGPDTLIGLQGNDTYLVDDLADLVVEDAAATGGTDGIVTSVLDDLGSYSLEGVIGVENLRHAGTGAAILAGNDLSNRIEANALSAEADWLTGAAGNDSLFGFLGNDWLQGGAGNDLLDGGSGNDTMIGGAGNDTYVVSSLSDRVIETEAGGFDSIRSSVLTDLRLSWAQQIEGLIYTRAEAAVLNGNALANVIESRAATNETMFGHDGADTLIGGAGADRLLGGTGDDVYQAGADDQVIEAADEGIDSVIGEVTSLAASGLNGTVENLYYTGAAGAALLGNGLDNLILGAALADTVTGGEGRDTLFGAAGADQLFGGMGEDALYGGGQSGTVAGGALVADSAVDTLEGGDGNDRYHLDASRDVVLEGAAGGSFDVVTSSISRSLSGFAHVEALVLVNGSSAAMASAGATAAVLVGNGRDTILRGGAGEDTLSGWSNLASPGPQSDLLEGGSGNDVLVAVDFVIPGATAEAALFGGAGSDLYVLGSRGSAVGGLDSGGTDTAVLLQSGSIANIEGVDNLYLWGANTTYDGRARTALEQIAAAAGFALETGAVFGPARDATGNDLANRIVGNTLANRLDGGAGNDTLFGGTGNDILLGGTGIDSLVGGQGDDSYEVEAGDVVVELAGGGFDILISSVVTSLTSYAQIEGLRFTGSVGVALGRDPGTVTPDYFAGGSGNDTLSGQGGGDTLLGGSGQDSLSGGAGDDLLQGEAGGDSLTGGADQDTLWGGAGEDQLSGDLGDDLLLGEDGQDSLSGGGNSDTLDGGSGADSLTGNEGSDALSGGEGNDSLWGNSEADLLVGGLGDDVLAGGSQDTGGGGPVSSDHLWGDLEGGDGLEGADVFLFNDVTAANGVQETFAGSGEFGFFSGATIGDFAPGADHIALAKEYLGNTDLQIDGLTVLTEAGAAIATGSEVVILRSDVAWFFAASDLSLFDPISAAAVTAVIGPGQAAWQVGATRLFVLDDGSHSALFLFQSNDGNAAVTADELFLLGVVSGVSDLGADDFLLV